MASRAGDRRAGRSRGRGAGTLRRPGPAPPRARRRGGAAAAAAFLQRAVELTPDPSRRGARALAGARAKIDAAAPEAASTLLDMAALCPLDAYDRACSQRLRAQSAFSLSRGSDALPLLLDAAKAL